MNMEYDVSDTTNVKVPDEHLLSDEGKKFFLNPIPYAWGRSF